MKQQVRERENAPSLYEWLVALVLQGGLTVEGDETIEDLSEAITYLVESQEVRGARGQ